MPWEKLDESKEITPHGRLAFVFQTAKEESLRLRILLNEAKAKNLWTDISGEAAFAVQMVPGQFSGEDTALAGKREAHVKMV